MSVAVHESAHCAIALAVGKRVSFIERDPGIVHVGEMEGRADIPIGEEIDRERVMIAIGGYMAVGRPGWPPTWDSAFEEELEALNLIMLTLWLDPEEYAELVRETQRLLERPDVRRFIGSLSMVLDKVPRVYEPEILAIAKAVDFPIPEPEGEMVACSI